MIMVIKIMRVIQMMMVIQMMKVIQMMMVIQMMKVILVMMTRSRGDTNVQISVVFMPINLSYFLVLRYYFGLIIYGGKRS